MSKKTDPKITAFVFDTVGILAWLAAAFLFYREETMPITISDPAYAGGMANLQLMHMQTQTLIVSCIAAVIGTLLLGFAALLKHTITSPGS